MTTCSLFSVVLKDPRDANDELVANDQGIVTSRGGATATARRRRCCGR